MSPVLVPVSKSAGVGYAVKHAGQVSLAHPKRLAVIAGTGGAAFGSERVTGDHKKTRAAEGAVGGGVAGWGAHQALPYPIKWQARNATQWNARQSELNDRPELKRTVVAEQKMRGKWQRAHKAAGTWNTPASRMYRDFPLEHRRARTMRAFGYTHGGHLGEAVSLVSIAAGATLGAKAAHHREQVSKGMLLPMIRVISSDVRSVLGGTREMVSSAVTPSMRESVRRTAATTPRQFVYAGAARKGGGLVLLAHADRTHRDR